MNKNIYTVFSFILIFILWIMLYIWMNTPLLFPSPIEVLKALTELILSLQAWHIMLSSMMRLTMMVFLSLMVAMILALYTSRHQRTEMLIRPLITILRTIPFISIIVILLILTGFSYTPYIATFLMVFPLLYQGIFDAIKDIPQDYKDVFKLEDESVIRAWIYNELPLIKNQFATVLLQACGLGVKVLIMTEYLSQTPNSIGRAIYNARIYFFYDQVFAWTIILIMLVLIFEMAIRKLQTFNLKHT